MDEPGNKSCLNENELNEIRRENLEAELLEGCPESQEKAGLDRSDGAHDSGTEIIGRERTYHAHVFDVSKLTVRLPDGRVRKYDLVEHLPAVAIIPVTDDGDILFVRQYRMGAEKEMLELPAGILNISHSAQAEDPLEAARRECREETGYEAGEIERIGGIFMTPGYCSEYIHIFGSCASLESAAAG